MHNILEERIRSADLTKTQKIIAGFFLENQDRIAVMSSYEVAQAIGVSDASVIRFSRTIGFKGFSDLKAKTYEMIVSDAFPGLSLTERLEQSSQKYSGSDRMASFASLMLRNVERSFSGNSQPVFNAACDVVLSRKKRYVVGLRGTRGIAASFSRLLAFMLSGVVSITDEGCTSINSLQDANEDSCVIMFAYTRYYKIDETFLRLAADRGAEIILVTNDPEGYLSKYADIVLKASTENMLFFHSNIGMEAVAEYLLTLIGQRADYKERIAERDLLTENQRI